MKKPYEQMDDLGGPPLFLETPKYVFIFIPTILGEMIQFDKHIFQMGWFNHQLDNIIPICFDWDHKNARDVYQLSTEKKNLVSWLYRGLYYPVI